MSTENSSSTAESPETTSSPSETVDTTGLSLREQLAAALDIQIDDTPEEPVESVTTDVTVDAEPEAETPAVEALEAPTNWPAEQREKFTVLPRETQEWLLSRDKDMVENYTRKTTELAEQRKAAEEITSVLEPYKQQMELAGIAPAQAIQRLLAAQKMLETNPTEGLKWLAQQYQVDLSRFTPTESEAYTDPVVKELRDRLAKLESEKQRTEQQVHQQNVSQAQKLINDFKGAKQDDGSLKYPHFDKVEALMGPLVAQGKTLEEAYDITQYTVPEIRERIASEAGKAAQAEALKKTEEARRAKAKEVKGASQVIRSRGTATEDAGSNKSLRQELAANLAALQTGRI